MPCHKETTADEGEAEDDLVDVVAEHSGNNCSLIPIQPSAFHRLPQVSHKRVSVPCHHSLEIWSSNTHKVIFPLPPQEYYVCVGRKKVINIWPTYKQYVPHFPRPVIPMSFLIIKTQNNHLDPNGRESCLHFWNAGPFYDKNPPFSEWINSYDTAAEFQAVS